MTRKPAIFVLTALAAALGSVHAQEVPFRGSVSVTGIATDVKSGNPWRFQEYRDLDDGMTAGLDLRGHAGSWYYNLFGENLGRDDQFAQLRGGRYGLFRYSVYVDDIIHNFTFGAITPFSGVGTNNPTFAGTSPSLDTATWNRFDYRVKHKNVGGAAEASPAVDSPFYLRVAANRKRSDGLRPLGAPGTSPGGPTYELPLPIDWTTTDWSGEIGYATRQAQFSVSVLWSKFEAEHELLFWRSPVVATGANIEASTIAPDSDMRRIGVNGMLKRLPLDSTLSARATYTKYTSGFPIRTTYISVTGTIPNTTGNTRLANPSISTFDGEVVNKSLSLALNSRLGRGLDSKIYYNWYERENDSTHVTFTPSGPGSGGACDVNLITGVTSQTCTTEFLHFEKKNAGAEVQYRIARANKLTAGIDYLETERERHDFDKSKETRLNLEWKSGTFEVADVRVKYTHLERKSEFLLGTSTNIFNRYLYRFDVAPLDRDQLKVVLDASPAPLLDLGAEFIFKRNKYKDAFLGRLEDKRREVALSASYGDPRALRVHAFADYERAEYDSRHWVGATTTFPSPNTAGTAYLWESNVHDENYLFGIAADWRASDRLKLVGSFIYTKADGGVDFVTQNNLGMPVNIDRYDNYRKRTLNLRAVYAATKKLDVTVGAAYEKYDYSDIQLDDYIHNIRTGTSQNFFSGAYAFPSYRATVAYVTVAYRF